MDQNIMQSVLVDAAFKPEQKSTNMALFWPDGTPVALGPGLGGGGGEYHLVYGAIKLPDGSISTGGELDEAKVNMLLARAATTPTGVRMMAFDGDAAIIIDGHAPAPATLSEKQPERFEVYMGFLLVASTQVVGRWPYFLMLTEEKLGNPFLYIQDGPVNRVTTGDPRLVETGDGLAYVMEFNESVVFDLDEDVAVAFNGVMMNNNISYKYRVENTGTGDVWFAGVTIDGLAPPLGVPPGGSWGLAHIAQAPTSPLALITLGGHVVPE